MTEDRQTYRKAVAKNASVQRKREQEARAAASRRNSSAHSSSSDQIPAKIADTAKNVGSGVSGTVRAFMTGSRARAGAHGAAKSGRGNSSLRSGASMGAVDSFKTRFFSSRAAMVIAIAILVALAVGLFDTVANNGKAFGNVSVNGQSVAGMTQDQIREMLQTDYAAKLSTGQVRIFASEEAQTREQSDRARQESIAQAEQVAVEEARANATSWTTSASELRATIPYDEVIDKALSAGREGGIPSRLKLFFVPEDITFDITFDEKALDDLASNIDDAIGDARIDATVSIEEGVANAVKGHDGMMVDRAWLSGKIADALLSNQQEPIIYAEVTDAPSRTTYEQAQQMSTSINTALNSGLTFSYHSQTWSPDAVNIGSWTRVKVAEVEDGFDLKVGIDSSAATSDLVKHLDASTDSSDVIVDFESVDDQIMVKTSGSGIIPEVGSAVDRIGEVLYGPGGAAWGSGTANTLIEVGESNAPEQLTFDQAVDMSLIAVIGEYTTEFSDAEGTENRNHNIKLAADLLNNTITESNGGQWSFNTHSGDTNQDPPFASAGSIVDGEYVDSIGGGICQVATTVFNAVYEAGLDIVDRHNHSLYIASYPTGRDAAVSYPEWDFVWSNPLKSDVLLLLSYTNTTLTAKLYSTPTGYKVSTETGEWEEGEQYGTTFESDEDLESGDYYLKTTGSDGSEITITRTVTNVNGEVIKEDTFTSTYAPKDEVYAVGPGTDTGKLIRGEDDEDEDDESSDDEDEEEDESESDEDESDEESEDYSEEDESSDDSEDNSEE